ncbi:MAG TPA: hypothetical protein DCO79_14735, partial [Spirochaeta sp.]|nr:hypothetical protein [Spirochaeta sp.]
MGDVETWSRSFRVVAVDLPGEPGLSSDQRPSPSGDDFSSWLAGLLDELGYTEQPVSIVGQSLGAFAALKFAVKYPSRVNKLSMLTTSGISPTRLSFMFKALPMMLLGKWGSNRINRMISYGADLGDEAAGFGALVSKHCRPLTEVIPIFPDAELSRLTMPVQYFGGDHDVLLNSGAAAARLQELLPKA